MEVGRRRGKGEETGEEGGREGGRGAMEAVRAWVSARRTAWSESQDWGYLNMYPSSSSTNRLKPLTGYNTSTFHPSICSGVENAFNKALVTPTKFAPNANVVATAVFKRSLEREIPR
jgi:hypothetical protein